MPFISQHLGRPRQSACEHKVIVLCLFKLESDTYARPNEK